MARPNTSERRTTPRHRLSASLVCQVAGSRFPDGTTALLLNISKTDAPDPVNAGSNITYTINYSNTGNANASGVVITDTIPANTSFVSATGGGTLAAGVVTWNVGALNAGSSGSVQLVVAVASPLANGTIITNGTYSVDSNETAPTSGAAVTTTVSSSPILNILDHVSRRNRAARHTNTMNDTREQVVPRWIGLLPASQCEKRAA